MKLVEYLAQLNSCEEQWGIWVNPADLDDYRVGQCCFENGGLLDEKVFIGTFDQLSFGFQSTAKAIEQYADDLGGQIRWGDRLIRVDAKALRRAYEEGYLDPHFRAFLESEARDIELTWAENEAENKVEELRQYFAPGGEWEQERAIARAEAEAWGHRWETIV